VDLTTGKETKLAHDPKSDINEIVFVDGTPLCIQPLGLGKNGLVLVQETLIFYKERWALTSK